MDTSIKVALTVVVILLASAVGGLVVACFIGRLAEKDYLLPDHDQDGAEY